VRTWALRIRSTLRAVGWCAKKCPGPPLLVEPPPSLYAVEFNPSFDHCLDETVSMLGSDMLAPSYTRPIGCRPASEGLVGTVGIWNGWHGGGGDVGQCCEVLTRRFSIRPQTPPACRSADQPVSPPEDRDLGDARDDTSTWYGPTQSQGWPSLVHSGMDNARLATVSVVAVFLCFGSG
jgi:hypothetical protein